MKHFVDESDGNSAMEDYEFNMFSHWKDEEPEDDYDYGIMHHMVEDYDSMEEYESHIGCHFADD